MKTHWFRNILVCVGFLLAASVASAQDFSVDWERWYYSVDGQSIGVPPPLSPINNVRDDQGTPAQQVTVYLSPADTNNTRVPELTGTIGAPPLFQAGDAITGWSSGRDGTRTGSGSAGPGALLFSVDRASAGQGGTAVRLDALLPVAGQAASIYISGVSAFGAYSGPPLPPAPTGTNLLALDSTALGLRPSVMDFAQDNVTSLELSEFGPQEFWFAAFAGPSFDNPEPQDGDGIYYAGYFQPGSPPFGYELFALMGDLGLHAGDVIDALVLSDVTSAGVFVPNGVLDPLLDEALFSLTAGSTTLWGADGAPGVAGVDDDGVNGVDDLGEVGLGDDYSPADIFYSNFDGPFSVFAFAEDLGLLATDNVDGMDIVPEPATLLVMGCGAIGLLRRRRPKVRRGGSKIRRGGRA